MNIIGLTGLKRSGKDTVAKYIYDEYDNFVILAFADPIRDMIRILGVDDDFINYKKESKIDFLNVSYRHLAQTLGTEWGRGLINDDIWLNVLQRKINSYKNTKNLIISDVRFNNEAEFIKNNNGIIIQIIRDTGNIDKHPSEKGIDDKYIDYSINNSSSISHLYKLIDQIPIL